MTHSDICGVGTIQIVSGGSQLGGQSSTDTGDPNTVLKSFWLSTESPDVLVASDKVSNNDGC